MDNLEYKVLCSNTPVFGNREKLRQILAEEAEAGWRLVEKFDNYKIRLVRDIAARANDAGISIDPYRSSVGINNALYLGVAAVLTVLVIFAVIQLAAMSVS